MKCSSQRNCNSSAPAALALLAVASMKCSSQRNCNSRAPVSLTGPSLRLNEVQFPKELQRGATLRTGTTGCLNEVQFPKELQPFPPPCPPATSTGLNEVQFPKELQPVIRGGLSRMSEASMKCSSQRNCNRDSPQPVEDRRPASMKCSSQRNCNPSGSTRTPTTTGLNEVQFPKELQPSSTRG